MYTPKSGLLRSVILTTTAAATPSASCVGDASEAAQSALASPALCSAGQLGAYDDLTTTVARPANHHPSPDSTAQSVSSATSPILSPVIGVPGGSGKLSDADAYGPFIASLVNDWDEAYAEGLENIEGMKAELGDLTQGDFITVDFLDASTLLGSYLEARHALAGDDPLRDLESMHPRYYVRRSRRLRSQLQKKTAAASLPSTASSLSTASPSTFGPHPASTSTSSHPLPPSKRSKRSRKKRQPAPTPPSLPTIHTVEPPPSLDSMGSVVGAKRRRECSNETTETPPAKRAKKSSSSAAIRLEKWMTGGVLTPEHREWEVLPNPNTDFLLDPSKINVLPSRAKIESESAAAEGDSDSGSESSPTPVTTKSKTRRGRRPPTHQFRRLLQRLEIIISSNFDFKRHSSFSSTGWNGIQPPELARDEIRRLFRMFPDAQALYKYIERFYPVPYHRREDIKTERATFLCDKNGQIFFFRSFRAQWLMEKSHDVTAAINVLVGEDTTDPQIKINNAEGVRGPHWPIIIGHHRQSAKKPSLADWHKHNSRRVDEFMKLEIVQRIISWVSSVVEIVFPGVAERFRADAAWHKQHHGIEPMFGLFWNFCLNVVLPGQRRIHCDPHADMKNQIGVCVLLIYLLEGFVFDDELYTWLVIWEAGVAVQLPPWTLAMYPSALFYHFNLDVHMIKFVTVAGKERPTRQNSRPLGGTNEGRGSMVFFNQSTMRQSAALGFDTVQEAKEAGLTGTVDFGTEADAAFNRFVTFQPASATDFN
ncbi:hypothetical protein R3P38DRAFT_2671227 [Favolaschia claudopus]|uniref:Uncharacterized protein n=1 Tax=Favolaschia claudopus TaxID=2862362 RepID=A0AAV9Z368_9AGAR